MLTIIQGHAGMLLTRKGLPAELSDSTQAIHFAAERAASLTRQLLMFSRKNVIQPRQLDLRQIVSNMSKMLQRLLGETISLEFQSPTEIPLVKADTGMMEQVIMNLAVNARDAMPKGGRLVITASMAVIDENHKHPEARRGTFACLQVSDNGCGMDQATMARIFEPFFTTKEVGKGTGLGLATVYGIVKQHEGWIEVVSAPEQGTAFSVFLPACSPPLESRAEKASPQEQVLGGKETILVVEDESVLREMATVILNQCGYTILQAASGLEAWRIWQTHRNSIDLVLTDMVMPEGISGMELAQRLRSTKPSIKIVFASGYSMDDFDTSFLRQGHATFLQKPYTHLSLAKAVRDCLDDHFAPVRA